MRRRVVITGIGAVSGYGVGAGALWSGLMSGKSAVGPVTRLDMTGFRSRLAAEVRDFSAKDHVPKHYRKAVKVMARDIELAVAAAKEAVEDAKLATRGTAAEGAEGGESKTTYPSPRMGCQIGAGLIAAEADELTMALDTARGEDGRVSLRKWGGDGNGGPGGMDNLTPLWLLKYLPNMLACHVTIIHGCEGPSNTITCAEASGLLSIGESSRVIERGSADLCFSGGAESKLNYMGVLRMDLVGRLAPMKDGDDPLRAIRPYHPEGAGSAIGEGGGILILEEAAGAKQRGVSGYAEVAGFGAGHSLPNYEDGEADEGYAGAIDRALEDAGVKPEQIDAVFPIGSAVRAADRAELGALRTTLGSRVETVPLVPLTSLVGNCMAGAAALQMAAAAKAVKEQMLPPALVGGVRPQAPGKSKLEYVLVCTGALGGQNAAAVLRRVGP